MFNMHHFEVEMLNILDTLGIEYDTTASTEYETLEAITGYYNKHDKLMIWNGASDNTIFTAPEYNWMFRAWHDWHHVQCQHAFTPTGEAAVCLKQMQDVRLYVRNSRLADYMCMLLDAEINGQVAMFEKTGEFIEDQRQFTKQYVKTAYNVNINL